VLSRVTVRASDLDASARAYAALLGPLGLRLEPTAGGLVCADFALVAAGDRPPTRGLHVAFGAPSRSAVEAAWRAATEAGVPDDGAPGPRPEYGPDYFGAFVRDPDTNSAEAVHHERVREPGIVDHLWIRVADVAASRRFYADLAPHAGLRHGSDAPDRAQFVGAGGLFSLVRARAGGRMGIADTPVTEHVALAFPADVERTLRDPDRNEVVLTPAR
jgi:catechol 2,3-dioxygenase-like lactoylglutathione lyase family enzyme